MQIAELGVLLDSDKPSRDVPQVVKADILQTGHFKDYQSIVIQEIPTADDRQVREDVLRLSRPDTRNSSR